MSGVSLDCDMMSVSKCFSKTSKRGIVLAKELSKGMVTSKVLLTGMLKAASEARTPGISAEVVKRVKEHTLKGLRVDKYGWRSTADEEKFTLTPAAKQALVSSRKYAKSQGVSFVAAYHVVLALLHQEAVWYYLNGVCKIHAVKLGKCIKAGCTLQDPKDSLYTVGARVALTRGSGEGQERHVGIIQSVIYTRGAWYLVLDDSDNSGYMVTSEEEDDESKLYTLNIEE